MNLMATVGASNPEPQGLCTMPCWRLSALEQLSPFQARIMLKGSTGQPAHSGAQCLLCIHLNPSPNTAQWLRITPIDAEGFFVLVTIEQTVEELKQQIWQTVGVPVDSHRLTYREKELPNFQNLSDVCTPGELQLCLMTPEDSIVTVAVNSIRYRVPFKTVDTVESFKSRIQKVSGIQCKDRDLLCSGALLERHSQIPTISEEAVIDVTDSLTHCIFLKTPGKKEKQVEFRKVTSALLSQLTHIKDPRFTFQGRELPASNLLDSQFRGAIVLFGEVLLSLKTTLHTMQVAACLDSTIQAVKDIVAGALSTSPDCITLVYAGEILRDEYLVRDCEVLEMADIEVLFPYDAHFWVQVWHTRHLVNVTDCHLSLESVIRATTDEPFDYVLFNGQLLDEKLSISESQVYPGAIVILLTQSMLGSLRPIRTSANTFYCCRVCISHPNQSQVWRLGSECYFRLKYGQFRLFGEGKGVGDVSESLYFGSTSAWEITGIHEQSYRFRYQSESPILIPFPQNFTVAQALQRLQLERPLLNCPIHLYYKGAFLQPEHTLPATQPQKCIEVVDQTSAFVLVKAELRSLRRVDLRHLHVTVGKLRAYLGDFLSDKGALSTVLRLLHDSETLADAGVRTGERIYELNYTGGLQEFLIPPAPFTNFVVLKLEDGSSYIVRYQRSDSCAAIVAGIETLVQLPSDRFVLIFMETVISKTSAKKLPNGSLLLLFKDAVSIGSIRSYDNLIHFCRIPASWTVDNYERLVTSSWYCHFLESKMRIGHIEAVPKPIHPSCRVFLIAENKWTVLVKRPGLPGRLVPISANYSVCDLRRDLGISTRSRIFLWQTLSEGDRPVDRWSQVSLLTETDVCVRASSFRAKATAFVPEHCSVSGLCGALASQLGSQDLRIVHCGEILAGWKSLRECGFTWECQVTVLEMWDEFATVTTSTEVKNSAFPGCYDTARKVQVFENRESGESTTGSLVRDPASPRAAGKGKYFYIRQREQVVHLYTDQVHSVAFIVAEMTLQALARSAAERLGLSASQLSFSWSEELPNALIASGLQLTKDNPLHCISTGKEKTRALCDICIAGYRNKKNLRLPATASFSHLKRIFCSTSVRLFIDDEEPSDESLIGDYFRDKMGNISAVLEKDSVVTVSCPGGATVTHTIPPNTSVRKVKSIITSATSIPVKFQSLLSGDKALRDTEIVGIGDIPLLLRVTRPLVIVETADDAVACCLLPLTAALQRLKTAVKDQLGISEEEQRLYFRDSELLGNSTLESCGLFPGAKVTVLRPSDVHLRMQTPLSLPVSLYLGKSASIETVKEKAFQCFHTPVDRVVGSGVVTEALDLALIPRPNGYLRLYLTVSELPADTIILILESPPHLPVPLHVRNDELVSAVRATVDRITCKATQCIRYQREVLDDNQMVKETRLRMFSSIDYICDS